MKGVLLAGGTGTRLLPVTLVTNKHLLPVHDRPMCYWSLEVFKANGIREVMVVTGRERAGDVFRLLGSGREFGMDFTFRVQDEAGGIAQALALAEGFCRDPKPHTGWGEPFLVALGDNVFIPPPLVPLDFPPDGARVWLAKVERPEAYGVPDFTRGGLESGRITRITEKPAIPSTRYAVTGLYEYTPEVFQLIEFLKPSGRGELEVSDLNNVYAERGDLAHEIVPGRWWDAGASLAGLARVSAEVAEATGVRA